MIFEGDVFMGDKRLKSMIGLSEDWSFILSPQKIRSQLFQSLSIKFWFKNVTCTHSSAEKTIYLNPTVA